MLSTFLRLNYVIHHCLCCHRKQALFTEYFVGMTLQLKFMSQSGIDFSSFVRDMLDVTVHERSVLHNITDNTEEKVKRLCTFWKKYYAF